MSLHLAKYLSRLGWKIIILCVDKPGRGGMDFSLDSEIPSNAVVYRTSGFENFITRILFYFWILPDSKIGWYFSGLKKARQIIQEHRVDIIISRSTPIASHLIALRLKRTSQLPWIACFSDPWVLNPYTAYPCALFRKPQEYLEKTVLFNAERIIVTNEQTKQLFLENYPLGEKIRVISNSYDPEVIPRQGSAPKNKNLVITHTGNFYGKRSPEPFFKALAAVILKQEFRNTISVQLFGSIGPFQNLISQYHLNETVHIRNAVSRREALRHLGDSDILLLIDAVHKGESPFLPSKLMDYIGIGKPILAITPKGASMDVMKITKTGVAVLPDDREGIQKAIMQYVTSWQQGQLQGEPDWSEIQKYSAPILAQRFSEYMQEVIDQSGSFSTTHAKI